MYIQCTNYIKQNLNFALRSHHHFPLYRVSEGPCNGDFQLLEYQAGLYCIHFFSQNENTSILNETWHWHVLISFVLKVFQGVYLPSLLRLSPGWRILIADSYSVNSLPKASPTHSGIEPDTETLQGHTIFLFKKIVFLLFSPGMKAGVHFSGGFFWTGCILRDFFRIDLGSQRMLNQNNQMERKSNIYFFHLLNIEHCYNHWGYHRNKCFQFQIFL